MPTLVGSNNQFNISSHHPHHNHEKQILICLQANRKSIEMFDSLAMQIVSHIQTNLPMSYAFHQFDTALLNRLEPIIFSFLTHANKAALKQRMLQAWNSTFGNQFFVYIQNKIKITKAQNFFIQFCFSLRAILL